MKRLINNLFVLAMMWLSAVVYGKPGALFNIAQSGIPMAAEVSLCLNGKGPLSCQRAHVAAQNLAITAAGNHAYSTAGIKVLTPGYAVTGCTSYSKTGYCLFAVNGQTSTAITLNNTSAPKYAYVSDYLTANVYYCSLNANGSFNLCNPTQTTTSFTRPNYTTFAVFNGTSYAYVGDFAAGFVYQCTLNNDGTFNSCQTTPSLPPGWTGPTDVTFATVAGVQYAYVTDFLGNKVYQCTLNNDGTFNSCHSTPSLPPAWVHLADVAFVTVGGVQYAYVSDNNGSNGNVYQCTLNNDGTFNTCQPASLSPPSWVPFSVTFATVGGVQYAYVPNDVIDGNIYQCTLNNDGTFNSCQLALSSPPIWRPFNVTFATVNGIQYAYVIEVNSTDGNVYQCTLNNDGSFNACNLIAPSSPGTWIPFAMTFFY